MSSHFSARVALLDEQIVDAGDLPIGRVDDVELELPPDGGPPRVTALLTGAEALGTRLGGEAGELMAAVAARLRHGSADHGPVRLDPSLATQLEPMIELRVRMADLPEVAGLERWLADHFVARLPGAGDAAE